MTETVSWVASLNVAIFKERSKIISWTSAYNCIEACWRKERLSVDGDPDRHHAIPRSIKSHAEPIVSVTETIVSSHASSPLAY